VTAVEVHNLRKEFLRRDAERSGLRRRRRRVPALENVTFAIDGRVIGDAPGSDPVLLWPLELGGHTLRASARFADGSFATVTSAFEVKR